MLFSRFFLIKLSFKNLYKLQLLPNLGSRIVVSKREARPPTVKLIKSSKRCIKRPGRSGAEITNKQPRQPWSLSGYFSRARILTSIEKENSARIVRHVCLELEAYYDYFKNATNMGILTVFAQARYSRHYSWYRYPLIY